MISLKKKNEIENYSRESLRENTKRGPIFAQARRDCTNFNILISIFNSKKKKKKKKKKMKNNSKNWRNIRYKSRM